VLVDSRLVLVDGRAVLVAFPHGQSLDMAGLGACLGGGAVLEAGPEELANEFRYAEEPIPPLGQLFGVPLVLDERVTRHSVIVFRAFGESVYFEIPYEDYARLEQPRIAAFAFLGELVGAAPAAPAH
jgi:Ala-tRNA(Pro) deacylase